MIHNGIDLNTYSVRKESILPYPPFRLLLVEGNLGGGYDMGLDNAIALTETLIEKHNLPVELIAVGKISEEHRQRVETKTRAPIQWMGSVPRERIPEIMRSAHLFFTADLHPACPNSVIEALACGLPVVGFDTGAVNELVIGDSGRVVSYGRCMTTTNGSILERWFAASRIPRRTSRLFVGRRRFARIISRINTTVVTYSIIWESVTTLSCPH